MQAIQIFVSLSLVNFIISTAHADSFGSGANQFDIEFVDIGNPDNPGDNTSNPIFAGKVGYAYRIGKFEVSEDIINKANIVGSLGISHDNRGANKPATSISWFEAATFINWLNTSTGRMPAYKFNGSTFELWQSGDTGYNPDNPFRNSHATYFLPNTDEWYKAAYYDPNTGVYYDYPTSSNSVPDGLDFLGDTAFDAVFSQLRSGATVGGRPPNDVTDVGVLSPYGTAGQGGNVWEWEETEFDLVNDSSLSARGVRGGNWLSFDFALRSTNRTSLTPIFQDGNSVGFRVASIPEPCSLLLGVMASIGFVMRRRPVRLGGLHRQSADVDLAIF